MARLGFYNIKTIECLSREITTRKHQFTPLTKPVEGAIVEEVKEEAPTERGNKGRQDMRNNRKQKAKMKESRKITKAVSMPQSEARGHTGYLTFATKF